MSPILLILIGIPLLSLVWLIWANRRLKKLQAPRFVSVFLTVCIAILLLGYIWVILSRGEHVPKVSPLVYSIILLWGILSLPLIALPSMTGWSLFSLFRALAGKAPAPSPEKTSGVDQTRRQFLGTAAYGHFGRTDLNVRWEDTDLAETLANAAGTTPVALATA